jgi:hypothetical protein
MNNKDVEKDDEFTDRYIRWQSIRIEQMGFINNLVIGLASGILLWQGQILLTASIDVQIRIQFMTGAALFLASVIFGCILAYNRLLDFRLTAKIVRSLDKFPPSNNDAKQKRTKWRATTKNLGILTWILLPVQLITFLAGLTFLAIAVVYRS